MEIIQLKHEIKQFEKVRLINKIFTVEECKRKMILVECLIDSRSANLFRFDRAYLD